MDFGKIIERIKAILTTPRTEWPVAAAEPASVGGLYAGYIAIVAALPAIAGFIKGSLIGYGGFGITIRTPFTLGVIAMLLGYVLSLVMTYVVALVINAFAPTFGGQKDQTQALKTVAYAWTAYWIASIGAIVPWLGWLIGLAGGVYSIYLLYLGLPHTMKCPPDKAAGYTAVTVVVAIVLGWIIGLVVAGVVGTAALTGALSGASMSGMNITGSNGNGDSSSVSIDGNSALGKLAAMGQQAEQAGKQMDAAQKSGDSAGQQAAMGKMLGAVVSGGTAGTVEALPPDQVRAFLPDSLNGLKRTSISAQRSGAMGMQLSDATAVYSDGNGHNITLEVTDSGGAKGWMSMATAMAPEDEKETDHGYEKTYTESGRLTHEAWDTQSKSGEYSLIIAQRFSVKADGNADSIDQLKQAVGSVDLAKLESMKDTGVKSN